MKKILLITLLLIPVLGFSQTQKPIDGFLGIKFGASKADVIAAIKAKGGSVVNDKPDAVTFTGVNLGHLSSAAVFVAFLNNQVYECVFQFKAEVDDKTVELYNDLTRQVNDVYGPGKSIRKFKGTFTDGDGYEITALREGDADISTTWTDKANNGNMISAQIDIKLNINLFYVDKPLYDQQQAQQKAKEKGDF